MKGIVLGLLSLLLGGCGLVIVEIEPDQSLSEQVDGVSVMFDIGYNVSKSSISPEEDAIRNLNLYAFCDGVLVASGYFEEMSDISLKLLYGHTYNLYSLANTGRVEVPSAEDAFQKECVLDVNGLADWGQEIPMAWKYEDFVVNSMVERVTVRLERLFAKVLFSVDKSALDGLHVNNVRLCQSPLSLWPFRYEEGSRVLAETDVSDGDYATQEDLAGLNSGEKICFYVPENCQGRILDGNSDPWAKVPENISGKEGLCTYLEVECAFAEGGFYSGTVLYRLYLGKDSVADFNILRNSVLDVSLFLTGSGLGEVSWRVDADVSINDGYARGWLSRGLHSITDLYVGEKFIYTFELTPQMMSHLGGLHEKVRLCSCDGDGREEDLIEFSIPCFTMMSGEWYRFEAEGLCRSIGTGYVYLSDENGNVLSSLSPFIVQKPCLYVSKQGYVSPGSKVPEIEVPVLLEVNGGEQEVYLYMGDKDSYNLNSSDGVGFDFSQFEFSYMCADDVGKSLCLRVSQGKEKDDGPFRICSMSSRNNGSSEELSRSLLDFWSEGYIGSIEFEDEEVGIVQNVDFGLTYLPITLTLVDNGWAGYSDCQVSMIVDNPSNFPIKGQCWQLNMVKDRYNAISRNEIVDLYGKEFTRQAYEYVCGDFPAGQMPLYCSGDSFNAKGSCICHFPEISTQTIYHAALYDYFTQDKLYHHIDAVFENGERISKLRAVDNLSDGSMRYNIIYGNDPDMDGWDDQGIWLYSGGIPISKPESGFDSMTGVKPTSLSALAEGEDGEIKIAYDAGKGAFTACVDSSQGVGLQLDAEITVKASGYVSTTPNGTLFGSEDNYCSSNVFKKVSYVVLGVTPVEIDGGAVREAMNAIYSQAFYDSYNLIGSSNSYYHNAHPTSLEVSVKFSLSGKHAEKMVPLSLSAPSSVSFYHEQDGVTYSVAMRTTKQVNKVAIVSNLKK